MDRTALIPAAAGAGRRRFLVLGVGTAAMTAQAAMSMGTFVLAPALQREFGLTLTEVGILLAAPWLGSMSTALGWGMAADRFGERLTGTIGLTGVAVGMCIAAFAGRFGWLLAGFALAGAFGGAVNTATGSAIVGWFPPSERGLAMGIRFVAVPVGGIGVAIGFPLLLAVADTGLALLTLAGFAATCAAASVLVLTAGPYRLPRAEEGAPALHPLRDRRVWRTASATAFLGSAQVAITGFVVVFLEHERGLSVGAAAAVLAAMNVVGAAGRVGSGWLSDRRGRRGPLLRAIATGIVISTAAVAALAYSSSAVLVLALVVAGGLSMSWNALMFTVTTEIGGARPGAAAGMQQTFAVVSAATTPVLFAALVDATTWRAGFFAAALVAALGLYTIRPRGPRVARA
jgi:MFS family permease